MLAHLSDVEMTVITVICSVVVGFLWAYGGEP